MQIQRVFIQVPRFGDTVLASNFGDVFQFRHQRFKLAIGLLIIFQVQMPVQTTPDTQVVFIFRFVSQQHDRTAGCAANKRCQLLLRVTQRRSRTRHWNSPTAKMFDNAYSLFLCTHSNIRRFPHEGIHTMASLVSVVVPTASVFDKCACNCVANWVRVTLFPRLVNLTNVRTRVHLPNVCLFPVIAFPLLVYLSTRRTTWFCQHMGHLSVCQSQRCHGKPADLQVKVISLTCVTFADCRWERTFC